MDMIGELMFFQVVADRALRENLDALEPNLSKGQRIKILATQEMLSNYLLNSYRINPTCILEAIELEIAWIKEHSKPIDASKKIERHFDSDLEEWE